jgi:hypothetical protein
LASRRFGAFAARNGFPIVFSFGDTEGPALAPPRFRAAQIDDEK